MKNLQKLKEHYKKLGQEIEALEGGRWKPEEGEVYFFLSGSGNRLHSKWEDFEGDYETYAIGNCYKTEEQAQAVIDLKKHIYKFPMPGDEGWSVDCNLEWESYFEKDSRDVIDYHSGIWINYNATEKDREERLRLLKLAYNID